MRHKRKATPTGPQPLRCMNQVFGCGLHVEAARWNRALTACTSCCARASARWRIPVADLSFLLVAWCSARAAAGGQDPRLQDVVCKLEKMGIHPQPAPDSALPEADRMTAA